MVTRAAAIKQAKSLIIKLRTVGYPPTAAYLFGSVAKGQQHAYSDIDIALWDEKFTGSLIIDYEPIKHILRHFPTIELHTFSAQEDERSTPFIGEIKKDGILLLPIPRRRAAATGRKATLST